MDGIELLRSDIRVSSLIKSVEDGECVSNGSKSKKFNDDFVKFLEVIIYRMKEDCLDYAITVSKRFI